jgi:DNA-binding NtrC family response regulator
MNRRLLVVDDDLAIFRSLKAIFVREGFDVLMAEDGEAGLVQATADKPDVPSAKPCSHSHPSGTPTAQPSSARHKDSSSTAITTCVRVMPTVRSNANCRRRSSAPAVIAV